MKNHFEIIGDSARVFSNGKNKQIAFFIDKSDLDIISQYSWRCYTTSVGYTIVETSVSINGKIKHFEISRFLMNFPENKNVDHIDCDRLNNRRNNLRLATDFENCQNVLKHKKNCSSKYKGVSYHKLKKKWIAGIRANKKSHFLGYFFNETDAALAYNQKAKELHGDFAKLNEIKEI